MELLSRLLKEKGQTLKQKGNTMFKNLTDHIKGITKRAETYYDKIEKELDKLHAKRDKRHEELVSLESTLPYLKQVYEAIIKSFGYSENDLKKEDAKNVKNDIQEAIKRYKDLEQSIREIEESIKALEIALIEDVEIESTAG